jgi:FkbM family methyltransferase
MRAVEWLNSLGVVHFAIDHLRLRKVLNAALKRVPIVRTLPSGVRYRCRFVDSVTLADDIFGKREYDLAVSRDVRTFVDLGCNVGHFVAFLADKVGRREIRGLAVDADPRMIEETHWLLAANGLSEVVALHGLVGAPDAAAKSGDNDFFLHPCTIKSSTHPVDEPGDRNDKGAWKKIRVGAVDLEKEWRARLGDARCNLLKIDIEGSEAAFVTENNPFLRRVDAVVIEIHKWIVAPAEIDARLRAHGFTKLRTLKDTAALQVAHYARG